MSTPSSTLSVFLLLIVCLCSMLAAQSARVQAVNRPPVPFLNPDQSIPAGLQKYRVFIDRSTGDAFVLFHPGERKLIPVELQTHVEPSIATNIAYDASSKSWRYTYNLANGLAARQLAVSWYFKDLTSERCAVSVPNGWYFLFPDHSSNPPWPRLVIASRTIAGGIAPGKEVNDFVLESTWAPGVEDVYVQGGTSKVLAMPAEPDDTLAAELRLVLGFPYNYWKLQTIGPRFNVHFGDFVRIYEQEIFRSEAQGACSHAFAASAIAFLKASAQDKKNALDNVNSAAKNEIEKGLTKTLQIASTID